MTDEMKLLRAFIEASGFNVKEEVNKCMFYHPNEVVDGEAVGGAIPHAVFRTDYKVTKREKISRRKGKSQIHKIVREYESGMCSVSEMLNEIARMESAQNE